MKPNLVCIDLDNLAELSPEEAERQSAQYYTTLNQFYDALNQEFAVKGALMPDAHPGYALPIGGVIATKGVVVPAWVGYDIGCGVSATRISLSKKDFDTFMGEREEIKERIKARVPVGFKHRSEPSRWPEYEDTPKTEVVAKQFDDGDGFYQLGTLGGGNHFIEIGIDDQRQLWIVVHSGSRNVGHKTAQHYMRLAAHSKKAKEGHYGFLADSKEGANYLMDQNFCRAFALANRIHITMGAAAAVADVCKDPIALDLGEMINRNHNHVVFVEEKNWYLHRKGATQAEKGRLGVIPGNMRDGSYLSLIHISEPTRPY